MKTQITAVMTAFVLAAFCSGCASVYRVALTSENSAQLKTADTSSVIAIEKDEIGTSIEPSNMTAATGGGLLIALADSVVNSSKSKRAETGVAGIRNGLLDYSFERALTDAFEQRFGQPGQSLAITALAVSKNTASSEIAKLVRDASGDAVAVVFVRHLMSPDFSEVVLVTEAVVCAKSEALRKQATMKTYAGQEVPVLYRNKVHSFWPLPAADKPVKSTRISNTEVWTKDGAGRLCTALDTAAGEIAEILHWDLLQPMHNDSQPIDVSRQSNDYTNNAPTPVRGPVYRREGGRVWLRTSNGCLYAQPE